MRFACLLSVLAILAITSEAAYNLRPVGNFSVPNPSFLGFVRNGKSLDFIITSFTGNPFAKSQIYNIYDFNSVYPNLEAVKATSVTDQLLWPNQFTEVPAGLFGACDYALLFADGFLVPGKSDGNLYVIKFTGGVASAPIALNTVKSGYFYHMTVFVDMNGDGKLDILTARATKPLFGSGTGELLWLEQPANPTQVPWTEHVLVAGPDVIFATAELDGQSNTLEVVAAEFFSQKLSLHVISLGATVAVTKSKTIDDTIGPGYSVQLADLNNDGKKELLVTNHQGTATLSGLFAYEIPADPINGVFTRHDIYKGFPVDEPGFNQASPGFAYIAYPKVADTVTSPPDIYIAGDGAQRAYRFTFALPYQYQMQEIIDTKGTVGALALYDVDGDGFLEAFVPDYDHGIVYVFTFSP